MKPRNSNLLHCLTVCLTALTFQNAHAASATWTGGVGGTGTNLSSGANWSTGSATFVSGDVAIFDSTTALGLLTLSANIGPGFGATDGLHILYTGTSNLTIDGVAGTPGLQWGLGNVTINPGAGAFSFGNGLESTIIVYRGASNTQTYTNNSANIATFGADTLWRAGGGSAKIVNIDGSGNWQFNAALRIDATQGQTNVTVVKNGSGTVNFAAANNLASTPSLTINQGTLNITSVGSLGSLGSFSGTIANNAAFGYGSSASQTISGIISGSGTVTQSAGNLTLTAVNTYGGATTINGGTLTVGGTGSINSSSGITVNGTSARYLHTSTTASDKNITLTQGTVGGTGTISAVTVGNSTGGVIANGNGNSVALTLDSLTFNGAAAVTVTDDGDTGTSGVIVTSALTTTPANGQITVNASSPFWNGGSTYNLINAGSFGGTLTDFTLGTITGLTSRQSGTLVLNGTTVGLLIGGDSPKWSGLDNSNWVVGTTGANGNWKLINGGAKTDFIEGDVVLFDDSATNTTVTIPANVSPAVVNFNNSSPKNYIINGVAGIAAGTVNKSGSGSVTFASPNTYAGGTVISAGTIALSGSGTLGAASGSVSIADATLNLGGTSQTVGPVAITGQALVENGTLTTSGLTASVPLGSALISSGLNLGSGNLTKTGDGVLTVAGTTAYSGTTTISGGILALSGAGSLGSSSGITLSGGSLDLGGSSQSTNAVTISAASLVGDTLTNGTISPVAFSYTATSGVATVSANIAGSTGITATGTANVSGTLTLTGENTFTGPLNYTGPATVRIDGGSNSGGGAINFNSFGSTFTMAGGSYATSAIASSGNSNSRSLGLNGGTLESAGNLFADNLAIQVTFNGGTLKSMNASGITVFDFDNTIPVFGVGGTFDTTIGNVTIGKNSNASAGTNLPKITGAGTGTVTIIGGGSLLSGFQYTGTLEIQDNSTWNLDGTASSVGGLSGDGSVTNSIGSVLLQIASESFSDYSGTIAGGADLSLEKLGTGTQTLSGNNSYQGDTTVSAGVLAVTGNALPNSGKLIITAGVVDLTGTETVGSLFFGAAEQATGTWGSSSSVPTPDNIDDSRFSGSGVLSVVTPVVSGYDTWATANAGGETADLDFDKDCVSNGVEYFMGQTGSSFTANPGLVGGTVTWPKDPAYVGTYAVQTSSNLVDWVPASPAPVVVGNSVQYTPGTELGKVFIRLVVTPN